MLSNAEHSTIVAGVQQRAKAIYAFLEDHYSGRRPSYLQNKIIPRYPPSPSPSQHVCPEFLEASHSSNLPCPKTSFRQESSHNFRLSPAVSATCEGAFPTQSPLFHFFTCLPRKVIKAITSRSEERRKFQVAPKGNWSFWYGPDIVRGGDGQFYICEDNLGYVGGWYFQKNKQREFFFLVRIHKNARSWAPSHPRPYCPPSPVCLSSNWSNNP